MMPQPVAKPLHGRPGDEHRAFEAIGRLPADLPADRRQQAMLRSDRPRAGVQQQKAAGAVSVLGFADRETGLTESGRLLVAGAAADRNLRAEPFGSRRPVDFARRTHLGQHLPRNVQDRQEFVVPIERVDVEDQRAAGVADVGHVTAAAGEPPDQKGIDRAEENLARLGSAAKAWIGVEQMLDLRAGEIRVEHQAGLLAKKWFESLGLEPIAFACRHAALPDDRVGHRPARVALPENRRLALVRHADGRDVGRRGSRLVQRFAGHHQLRRPNRLGSGCAPPFRPRPAWCMRPACRHGPRSRRGRVDKSRTRRAYRWRRVSGFACPSPWPPA